MPIAPAIDAILHRLNRVGFVLRFTDPVLKPHAVFDPQSQWKDTSVDQHTNQVHRVRAVDGGDYFVKKASENPVESHIEPAARNVMRTLGFTEIPPATRAIDPNTGDAHIVTPWVEPRTEPSERFRHLHTIVKPWNNDSYLQNTKGMFDRFGHKRLTDLLTAHWLIGAQDRNRGNYMVDKNFNLAPIDYGETFSILPWSGRSDNEYMRGERESSPHHDALFDLMSNAGIAKWDTPLNEYFIKHLKRHEPFIRDTFEKQVAPHLPVGDAESARAMLNEKFEHLDRLGAWFKDKSIRPPTLRDLPKYVGMERE